ncbi:MAG: hypothetical protein ACLTTU_09725 [Bilophila wadsworthia]
MARRTPIRLSSIPTQRRNGERQHEHADEQPRGAFVHTETLLTELNMGCGAYISV